MAYREDRRLEIGHHAEGRDDLAPRACVLVERADPRLVALVTHHPDPILGVAPIELIERVARASASDRHGLSALFAAIDDALAGLMARITDPEEEFAVGWSFGAHAVAVERVGPRLYLAGAGNGRLYRLRSGRVSTVFGGQTVFASLPRGSYDPAELADTVEKMVTFVLGGGRRPGQVAWHGPVELQVETGDRLLLTTYRTVQRLTSEDLQDSLQIDDRGAAARAVVRRGRAKVESAADPQLWWTWGEAVVLDVG
ncbi:MAG: hypothetical protein KC619_03305 [Myxococcales bacterium]|nr:hypothetical protein [Myxococcales bacterium]